MSGTNLCYAMEAYQAENYLPIHEPTTQNLCPAIASPEDDLLVRERYQLLSKDAKYVIDIVLDPPEQLNRRLQIKNRKTLCQEKLTEFLRLIDPIYWKFRKIKNVFNEVKTFLKEDR